MRYRAAAVQYEPALHMKQKNEAAQLKLTVEAARNGAKLIVLPEMNQVGYCFTSREEISPYVEPVPGPTTERYAEVARRHEAHIVVGLAEVNPETKNYYNSQALVGPDGFIGKYRKTHSYISEPRWAKDGNLGFPVFSTEIGNLGMLVCMDYHFFESSRVSSLKGADVMCFSSAWLDERGPPPVWMTRSFENGIYAVCADRWGLERGVQFTGGSCILNPDGSIQSWRDAGDGIVYGEIDIDRARNKEFPVGDDDRLKDRLPENYMQVTRSTYLWSPQKFFALYSDRQLPEGKKSVVTVAQFLPRRLELDKNIRRISAIAGRAATAKCDLLVLPELAATGAVFTSRKEADGVAEGVDGNAMKALTSVAKRTDLFLVTSFVERDANRLYNTAVLVGKKGVVGKYRKVHLNHRDRVWAAPGNLGFPTFDIPVGRVGLAIGHDSMFPESFRCLSADGADLICVPSALEYPLPIAGEKTSIPHPRPIPRRADPTHWHLWRVRAGENCTYVAFANQCGAESGSNFFGFSGIFQPDLFAFPRKETVAASGEDLRSLTIDTSSPEPDNPSNQVRAKYLLRMRQPYWYDPVVIPQEGRRPSQALSEPSVGSALSPVSR